MVEQLLSNGSTTVIHHILYTLLYAHDISKKPSASRSRKKKPENQEEEGNDNGEIESLVDCMVNMQDAGRMKPETTPSKRCAPDKTKKEELEKFLEGFYSASVSGSHFDIMEKLQDILLFYSVEQRRPLRLLSTHALTLMLKEFGVLCMQKIGLAAEAKERNKEDAEEKEKEAKEQEKWLRNSLEIFKDKVLLRRNSDVMPEVRVLIAECLQKLVQKECIHFILDKRLSKVIGQLVFDKNKNVKKLALALASEILEVARHFHKDKKSEENDAAAIKEHLENMYDARHISKIIQIGYLDTPPVAIQAIRTLSLMKAQDMLDDYAIDFVCKLTLRKSPQIAKEAAQFAIERVGEGKVLGTEYAIKEDKTVFDYSPREAIQSAETLSTLLMKVVSDVNERKKKKSLEMAIDAFEKVTVSVYDLRSMCDLLMRGEKDQATESKLPEEQLNILADILHIAFKKTRNIGDEDDKSEYTGFKKRIVGESDSILLNYMPQLLTVHKHSPRVASLIKAACLIAVESIKSSETHLKQTLKTLKRVCDIFSTSTHEESIAVACKLFYYYSKLTYIDGGFSSKVVQQYERFLNETCALLETGSDELRTSKHILLVKLPIILGYVDIEQITFAQERLIGPITKVLTEWQNPASQDNPKEPIHESNLQLLSKSLFYIHANAFAYLYTHSAEQCDKYQPEKYDALRKAILGVFTQNIKREENDMEFRMKLFALVCNILCAISSDSIRVKYNHLYYDIDNEILGTLNDFFLTFVRKTYENSEEIKFPQDDVLDNHNTTILEVNQSVQTLILTCEKVFHSELAVWYLAVFGSNQSNQIVNQTAKVFLRKLQEKCFVYNNRSMYYMYVKESISACYSFAFQYPEKHAREIARKQNNDGLELSTSQYYNLQRAKDLVSLVIEASPIKKEAESGKKSAEEEAKHKTQVELFQNFVIDLMKESLRSSNNFAMLDVVQICITSDLYTKEKMSWIYQLFEALSLHVQKVDTTIDDVHKKQLADFKSALFKKAAALRVKRGSNGKAVKKPGSNKKDDPIIENKSVASEDKKEKSKDEEKSKDAISKKGKKKIVEDEEEEKAKEQENKKDEKMITEEDEKKSKEQENKKDEEPIADEKPKELESKKDEEKDAKEIEEKLKELQRKDEEKDAKENEEKSKEPESKKSEELIPEDNERKSLEQVNTNEEKVIAEDEKPKEPENTNEEKMIAEDEKPKESENTNEEKAIGEDDKPKESENSNEEKVIAKVDNKHKESDNNNEEKVIAEEDKPKEPENKKEEEPIAKEGKKSKKGKNKKEPKRKMSNDASKTKEGEREVKKKLGDPAEEEEEK